MNKEKKLIVVLGMHRSGTSAITRGLQVLGASLGERLMPAIEGINDKGFFEDIEINAFNIELLSVIKSDWFYLSPIKEFQLEKLRQEGYFLRAVALIQEKIKSEDVFAFKDPRVAKLLPFWKEVFSHCQINVNYVLALRHPLSVVNSLAKRDGFVAEHSYLLWLGHILESLTGSRGAPRVLVDFDHLMQSPDAELVRIAKSLNLEICPVELQNYKTDFLDQGLRHTVFELNDLLLDSACPAIVRDVYSALLKVASGQLTLDDGSLLADISNWSDEFDQMTIHLRLADTLLAQKLVTSVAVSERDGEIARLNQTVVERGGQIASLNQAVTERDGQLAKAFEDSRHQLEVLNCEIAQLRSSNSWKITAPIRFFTHQIKRIRHLMRLAPSIMQRKGRWGAIRRTLTILHQEGLEGIKWRLRMLENHSHLVPTGNGNELAEVKLDYVEWIRRYDTLDDKARIRMRSRIEAFIRSPKFSLIMPVYDPPLEFLDEAIRSVRDQLYPNWELCIADDASKNEAVRDLLKKHAAEDERIRLVLRQENGHISKASNSALAIAQGDFIAMFDHDDVIPEHALYMFAEELNKNPALDFLYSDQDKVDTNGHRYDPYFKPDFNPDLLRSQNFVDHLAVFRTSLARDLGGWRSAFDGSQDYDFVLRFTERLPVDKIAHIPHVLYHWRAVPGSLAIDAGAKNYAATRSRQALAEHLQRMGISAEVTSEYPHLSIHRVVYPLPFEPLVSIVIPTKDGVDILRQCLDGIFNKTDYSNFEVIIVNNQSENPETHEYFDELLRDKRVRLIDYDHPFNYSRINNIAVKESNGSILALLNNDLEVINRDWLREMVSHAVRPEIGAVGARLFYPDGTVQHAGVLLGYKGRAGHMYRYAPKHWLGYWARAVLIQNLTAVTAACLVVRKDVYETVGGFDEENFTVTFNDVDLCLRIHEKGYRNLYTPYAELYHHESKTRGLMAFHSEEDYFSERWKPYIQWDTAYNPNLSLETEDFSLAFPPRVTRPWESDSSCFSVNPLVSIITRTYGDRQAFLKESIKSVLQQTYRPLQLVIVEDGTANAHQVIDELELQAGVSVTYESLPKRGRCFAGNRGMQLAQGELFGFLDDDDMLLPEHVESLVRHLQAHPEAVGAYSSSWEIPTEVLSLTPLKYIEGQKSLFGRARFSIDALWNYNYIAIQSLLLRKDLFQKHGGFSEELDCLEDWDLWLRYTSEHDFVFLDKATSEFRMPKSESVLIERRNQHLRYLPILRKRQQELLGRYRKTSSFERLRAAFNAIGK